MPTRSCRGRGVPPGNARLTAWTGLVLLVLFLAELVTLLDVSGLISWHLALGVALGPPALLKTTTTGWRVVRYYTGTGPIARVARRRWPSGCSDRWLSARRSPSSAPGWRWCCWASPPVARRC